MTRSTKKAKTQALPALANALGHVENDLNNTSSTSNPETDDSSTEDDDPDDDEIEKSTSSSDTAVAPPASEVAVRSPSTAPVVTGKRKRGRPPVQAQGTVHISNHSRTQYNYYTENPKKKITYLMAILTPEEAKKAQSKQAPVSTSLELWSDEPWDTVKAQFLVKISDALSPQNLDFTDYDTRFYIPHSLPKPGIELVMPENYASLVTRAHNLTSNTPTVNITIRRKGGGADKENLTEVEVEATSKAKKVDFVLFISHIFTSLIFSTEEGSTYTSWQRE